MAPRATFRGYLRLSLVSVPVKGFTAAVSGGDIRLNQLHAECNSRVQYQKICPTHGPLKSDEIVSGYEYNKGQYVVIDPEETQKLRKQNDKTVNIEGFIDPDAIEPRFYTSRTYYFLPDGTPGQKPYQLLHTAMEEQGLYALGRAILSGKEQMVLIRPIEELIGMTVLTYHQKIKAVEDFTEELEAGEVSEAELNLTRTLIDASMLEDFDYAEYRDNYNDQLNQIIEAKIEGQEIVAAPDVEEPKVINLMDALKASVENAHSNAKKKRPAKKSAKKKTSVKTKMAPSAKGAKVAKKKKKSG